MFFAFKQTVAKIGVYKKHYTNTNPKANALPTRLSEIYTKRVTFELGVEG